MIIFIPNRCALGTLFGVVIGLLVTGKNFNVMSLLGLVALVGIVVKDPPSGG